MQSFQPGDRVVAINTGPGPIKALVPLDSHPFLLPDGPLRQGTVYHVAAVCTIRDGSQGILLTGLRVLWHSREVPWNPGRFRKVGDDRASVSIKQRRKQPAAVLTPDP